MADKQSEEVKQPPETPLWEWIIAAVGLILVFGSISLTIYRAVTEDLTPPILSISVDSVSSIENGFLVQFSVKNTGTKTAADLNIEGELKNGEDILETSSVTMSYAPANSSRRGGLFFFNDPRQAELQLRTKGYTAP